MESTIQARSIVRFTSFAAQPQLEGCLARVVQRDAETGTVDIEIHVLKDVIAPFTVPISAVVLVNPQPDEVGVAMRYILVGSSVKVGTAHFVSGRKGVLCAHWTV